MENVGRKKGRRMPWKPWEAAKKKSPWHTDKKYILNPKKPEGSCHLGMCLAKALTNGFCFDHQWKLKNRISFRRDTLWR